MFRPFGSYAGSGDGKGRLERAVFAFLGERGEALGHTRFFVSLTTCRLGAPERGSYADPFGRRRSSGFVSLARHEMSNYSTFENLINAYEEADRLGAVRQPTSDAQIVDLRRVAAARVRFCPSGPLVDGKRFEERQRLILPFALGW